MGLLKKIWVWVRRVFIKDKSIETKKRKKKNKYRKAMKGITSPRKLKTLRYKKNII